MHTYCEAFFSEKAFHLYMHVHVRVILVQVLHISLPLSRPCSCRVLSTYYYYYYAIQGTCLQLTTWRERESGDGAMAWRVRVNCSLMWISHGNGNTPTVHACNARRRRSCMHACIHVHVHTTLATERRVAYIIKYSGQYSWSYTVTTYVQPTHFYTWHIERVRSILYT